MRTPSLLMIGALCALGLMGVQTPAQLPGEVVASLKIGKDEGGFTGDIEPDDGFGSSVTCIGDLDGNGVMDLAVGAVGDDTAAHSSVPSGSSSAIPMAR